MTDFTRELDIAHTIAVEATAVVMRYHGKALNVQSKTGDEPVTDADHAANALIVERLRASFPDDVILSEEIPDDQSRLGQSRVWMVDPIDGTRDFIIGHSGFAVMIGLAVDGRPTVGVVAQPLTHKIYGGIAGVGAWLDVGASPRVSLRTSTRSGPPGIRLVASKSHRSTRIDAVKAALQIEDEINIGSVGLKIGLVAEGERDLYVYTGGRTKLWDTCGPEAILEGAGGRMTDMDGNPLVYTGADLLNRRGIVASNGPLHDFVVTTIAPFLG
ncbi:MAG TPA: 3'(2'),5'-bisphosphate nucleotidase CysQ [Polyangia bacterium]|jgi:3'(2'), 5'-bisphosphate nucleotidase|nr:3'(2'),5'-bisphosphate nucleotidase CysQ [Polyangia bacterium]